MSPRGVGTFVLLAVSALSTAQGLGVGGDGDSPLSTTGNPSKVATGWFAGWHADTGFPVSRVSWSKYTDLTYAFA